MIIGIRSFLTEQSRPELLMQLREAAKSFPDAQIVVANCGVAPDDEIKGLATTIVHYSDVPTGLTKPWEILVDEAKKQNADGLLVVDGDDQFIFSELRRAYDAAGRGVVIPERERRVVFLSDSNLSRAAIEDLENAYLRMRYPKTPSDPQPGAYFILDMGIIQKLDFHGINGWVGDLAFLDKILTLQSPIETPRIRVRSQSATTLNLDTSFRILHEIEKYFGIPFTDMIAASKRSPELFLHESRLQDIENIRQAYVRYQQRLTVQRMRGLILAGGYGERLRPITYTTQKQIIPIANKPILAYVIEDLVEVGIRDIGIVVGPNKEQVKKTIGDGTTWNCRITYIEQDKPKGLAHAVLVAKDFLGDDDFVMYLGDNMLQGGIMDFVVKFKESKADASILLTPVKDPERFGIAKLNALGEVELIIEKPKEPPTNLAIIGIYAFTPKIFEACAKISPGKRGELEITDAMQWLLDHKRKITSDLVQGWWKDTGKADALLEVNHLVLDNRMVSTNQGEISPQASVTGRVSIGKGSRILENTIVRGPVIIGQDCTIGPNTFVGPYSSIGNKVSIRDTEIEHSIVLSDCRLSARRRIVDSVIGQNCAITCADETLPKGHKLIVGDNSEVEL